MGYYDTHSVSELVGRRIVAVTGMDQYSDEVRIECADGTEWRMTHHQDCCETVSVEEVIGDVSDLIDATVIDAREETSDERPTKEYVDSYTWTFYIIQTDKGAVTLRWLGESNGYYGEDVSFELVTRQ